jgi:peptidoglycan/LPS O-acetylase OafA/YrhL
MIENNNRNDASPRMQLIDGLRGIAILAVITLHWIIQPLSPFFRQIGLYNILSILAYGVDLFFVISGFLIGGILIKVGHKANGVVAFYYRRILRIWPLYYLLLGIVFLLSGGMNIFGKIPVWSFLLFIYNYCETIGIRIHQAFGPLWSLAIEEQFYFVAPILFLILGKKNILWIAIIYLFLSPIMRLLLLMNTNLDIWRFTPTRLDGICIGIILAIVINMIGTESILFAKLWIIKILGLLFLTISIISKIILPNMWWNTIGNSLMAIAFGFILLSVVIISARKNERIPILSSPFIEYIGVRCYSLYLYQILFMIIVSAISEIFIIRLVLQAAFTLFFSHMSWRYIEGPLIKYGQKIKYI